MTLARSFSGQARLFKEVAPFYTAFGWSGISFELDDLWGTYILGDAKLLQPKLASIQRDDEPAQKEEKGNLHSYHLFILRLDSAKLKKSRREIFERLKKKGLGLQVHYIPIPKQPFYRQLGYRIKDYPESKAYYEEAVTLPLFPKMSKGEVGYVIRTVKDTIRTSLK